MPDSKAEQVSQALFGEELKVIGLERNWLKVRCSWDGYEGWMASGQIQSFEHLDASVHSLSKSTHDEFSARPLQVVSDYSIINLPSKKISLILSMGSILRPFLIDRSCIRIMGESKPFMEGKPTSDKKEWIVRMYDWLGTPYLWGGRTRFGVDCSGFVQIQLASQGIRIPRDAQVQFNNSIHKFEPGEASGNAPGNLAFFGPSVSQINHVGIFCTENKIIHASGEIRLDTVVGTKLNILDTSGLQRAYQLVASGSYFT